jgi:hypothetical protein
MTSTDPRAQAAFAAATSHLKTTATAVAERVAEHLGTLATSTTHLRERDALISAQIDLRRNLASFTLVFGDALSKRMASETSNAASDTRRRGVTDWSTLSLVGDDEVEERMFADRISQIISHECEWELRELDAFCGSLLGIGRAEQERNPLRPEVIGAAVFQAIQAASHDTEARKLLAREIGGAFGKVMPSCYGEILSDMRARGVVPVNLSYRSVEGPGNEIAKDRLISGYSTLSPSGVEQSGFGDSVQGEYDTGVPYARAGGARRGTGGAGAGTSSGNSTGGRGNAAGSGRTSGGSGRGAGRAGVSAQEDAELMLLLRRLTALATRPGELGGSGSIALAATEAERTGSGFAGSGAGHSAGSGYADSLPGLMAVNLIRAHRDELRQASTGALDHMVIDVVGSLFDQILSDPRVPPQMARQIARLQLPVLRVALGDPSFFSSRKHPVRRFVNRIASLACAFDDFDDGPGRQFLGRVRALVQEIVEGDFDQMDVYTSKLNELEHFIATQARDEVQNQASAATLVDAKEADLRVQQRYMLQLRGALAALSLQEYLRDFLAQVWSQAISFAVRRDGPQSDLAQRLRRAGRELVMSVQPKGSPAMRKKFLLQLPPLMKDLNEGMRLIGWPEPAQKDFFAKLLPAHAESLKGAPISELEYNLLSKQLEGIFNTPVPEPDAMLRDVPFAPEAVDIPIEPPFSAEEKQRIGLVEESAVDWSGEVDIDLTAQFSPEAGRRSDGDTQPGALDGPDDGNAATDSAPLDLGIDIDLSATEPAEPSQGAQLMNHVRLGFAYQMHLNERWQKVRLSYVSPGRAFFVFTRGKKHQETVSLTARMLARMCETGRFRAFENTYLLERATARARKQLAALSGGAGSSTRPGGLPATRH